MKLQPENLLKAVSGICLHNPYETLPTITDIITDSRQIKPSSLYVPLRGEKFDGHDFISKISALGAVATLTEEKKVVDEALYTIWVKDTKQALLDLAAYYREQFTLPVIGVTGSVGKTSTKDLIAAILSSKWSVHKTEGNFNNEIGLPLTLFKLEPFHQAAVVEMGMNHFGEISKLTQAAKPNIAVITNIGTSHIENLGSREGILKAKLEILEGLAPHGLIVVNGDDELLVKGLESQKNVKTYGKAKTNDYYAENLIVEGEMISAEVTTPTHHFKIKIPTLGEHMIYNSLAGIAIAENLGLTPQQIQEGLLTYSAGKMRMHKKITDEGIVVIDDTYNASPDSMKAAINVLTSLQGEGKKIAVLGDMFELGTHSRILHEEVGQYILSTTLKEVYTVGEMSAYITEVLSANPNMESRHFKTQDECLNYLGHRISKGDIVLFKASRGMHFEKMVEKLGKENSYEK